MKAATLAGCTTIEHGAYFTDEVFELMAQRGTYYDPNIGLLLQNYLQNKEKFLGIGNYNEQSFAAMEKNNSPATRFESSPRSQLPLTSVLNT